MRITLLVVTFCHVCLHYLEGAPANESVYPLPDFCPLGEPLRSRAGDTVQCNCPPHPFCPKLYYCKIAVQGQAGICCPDFGVDRRHAVKPEDSRLPAIHDSEPKTQNCSLDICNQLLKSKDNVTTDAEQDRLISSQKGESNGTIVATTIESPKQNQTDKKCIAVPISQLPKLPDEKLCKYEDVGLDKDGCPLPPKAKCLGKFDCPKTQQPIVPPGCKLGQERLDERGCPKVRELICMRGTGPISPILVPRAPAPRPKQKKVPQMKPQPPGYKIKPGYKRIPMTTSSTTVSKITISTKPKPTVTTTFAPSPPPCPVYPLPATLSPDCVIAPPQKDSRGCYLPLEIVCEKQPTAFTDAVIEDKVPDTEAYITSVPSADPTQEPRKCPEILIPFLQPGCRLLPAKYDAEGCRLLPEVICDPTIVSRPKNTLECPQLVLPKMDPLCSFGPSRNDSNGCPMVPEVFCPSDLVEAEAYTTETTIEKVTIRIPPTSDPKMLSHCPYVPPPYLPPGCMYGVARYDPDGCSIAPEVICPRIDETNQEQDNRIDESNVIGSNTSIVETTMTPTTMEILPPNFSFRREFRDMLTAEFYHLVQSNISPDAGTFRRTTAIPYVTSGRFHFCRMHADCFHFREPKEWCETGHGSSDSVWTDKSCHCADDTIVPACVVERVHRGLKEWTFCADYSQCAINR